MFDSTSSNAAANVNGNAESQGYFDLHVEGIGYLNRIREVKVKKGQFLACSISAIRGDASDVDYTKFDVRVTGAEARDIVRRLKGDVDARKAVIVGFKLGDIYPEKFVYEQGDRKGGTGVVIKGRLLKLRFAKVDGQPVELPKPEADERPGASPLHVVA